MTASDTHPGDPNPSALAGDALRRTDASHRSDKAQREPLNVEGLLTDAEAALASIEQSDAAPGGNARPFELQDFASAVPYGDVLPSVGSHSAELDLRIELGRAQMRVADVLELRKGSVVPLDKLVGDPVDIYVDGRLVAHGEVLVLDDNYCVRIATLVGTEGDDRP